MLLQRYARLVSFIRARLNQKPMQSLKVKESKESFFHWYKGDLIKLSANFSSYEFECLCDGIKCSNQLISKLLVTKLQLLRDKLNTPLRITSGYRCQNYQDKLKKKGYKTAKNSQHLLGRAADITIPGGRYLKYSKKREQLTTLSSSLFLAIGVGGRFIHVDLRDDKKRRWTY